MISSGTQQTTFSYGPDLQRWQSMTSDDGTPVRRVLYGDDYERVVYTADSVREFYYLGHDIIAVRLNGGPVAFYMAQTEHLGSIISVRDSLWASKFHSTYDAWGNPSVSENAIGLLRGYTGHEMLPEYGLINMRSAHKDALPAKNGRLYDPLLGRFLSPDNYVQQPDNSQNFNRYTYCLNNPLKYTDPDGVSYTNGDLSLNVGSGIGNQFSGWNVRASYGGYGVGYARTFYNETTVKGNTWGKQCVGTYSLSFGDNVSLSVSNDMFGKKHNDRWRTSAVEISILNFTVGTYVTTNNGKEDSNHKTFYGRDRIIGHNPYKEVGDIIVGGAWNNGKVYSAPFWFGYRSGSQILRVGISHPSVQSLTQNFVHKHFVKTPFFLDYSRFRGGIYSYYGYNNPLSLW